MKNFHVRLAVIGSVCALVLSVSLLNFSNSQEEGYVFDTAPDMDNWTTGPEVGDTVPEIVGTDQHGNQRNFADIKGPNGAYVIFHRSADL